MKLNNITISKYLILAFLFICSVFPVNAQNEKTTFSTNEKLEQLLSSLQKDQQATKIWWNSWLGLYATGTVVQTGIALKTDNKVLKQDMFLGAATTILGTGSQLFTPIVKIDKNFFEGINKLTPTQRLQKMNDAYALLEQSAAFETEGRSWKMHALTGVVNIGGGLITWLAFDRTLKDGLINFAINTVITEAQIWSQPIIAKKALSKYADQFSTGAYIPNYKTKAVFTANATASGFHLKLVF